MKFIHVRNDLRVLQVDAYGPFTQESEFALVDHLRVARSARQREFRLEPEVALPGFLPRFLISSESHALFARVDALDSETRQSLRIASAGTCTVGNQGCFEIYDLAVVEQEFLSNVDFARSEFQLVGITLDRSGPPRVLQVIDSFNTYEDVRALRKANPIRKVLPTKITLKAPWDASFFQFFNYTYIASEVSLRNSGLDPMPATCELVIHM
jgi:hypothetical protein